ncbi:hypothetical protein HPC49_37420, partial [Pyxidicoccus fallax]|nr:hypothetical protein [Pyxidicoccus fallax]
MRPLPLLLLLLAAPVALAAPSPVTASWSPERVVLGQDAQVTVEVHVPPGSGPVRGVASSGGFTQDRVEGGEVRTFQWTPPDVRHPLLAVLAFWLEGGTAPPEPAVLRIPLLGKTRLDVSTAAGADVVVEVGGTRFGPVRADGRGRARVPVEVPPGVRVAQVLASHDSRNTHATIPLDPPEAAPLAAAFTPTPLDSGTVGWLLVAGESGLRSDTLEVSAEGATLSAAHGDSPPRYRVTPGAESTTIAVTVRRRGHKDTVRAETPVAPRAVARVEPSPRS